MFPPSRFDVPFKKPGPPKTGNSIFDNFISQILPFIESKQRREKGLFEQEKMRDRQYNEEQKRQEFEMQRGALPNIAQQMIRPPEPQMNTVMQALSPYQEAILSLRGRELESRSDLGEKIAKQRADIYEWKARNPNSKIMAVKGGNIIAIDPITKQTTEIKDATGQSISSGILSDTDLKELEQTNALERISATGEQQREGIKLRGDIATTAAEKRATLERELITLRGDQSIRGIERRGEIEKELIPLRGEQTRQTNEERPVRGEQPTQTKQRVYNSVNEFKVRNPRLGKFVSIDENTGEIKIKPVKTEGMFGSDGPTQAEYDEIVNAIFSAPEEKKEDKDAPPKGMKPGGKWLETRFGRVYQEPS